MRYIIAIVAFCVACASHTKQAPVAELPHNQPPRKTAWERWQIEIVWPQTPQSCPSAPKSQANHEDAFTVRDMEDFQNPQQESRVSWSQDPNKPGIFSAELRSRPAYYFRVYRRRGPGDHDLDVAFHDDYCGPIRIWTTHGSANGELVEQRVVLIEVMSNAAHGEKVVIGEYVVDYGPWEQRECYYTIGPPDPFPKAPPPDEDE